MITKMCRRYFPNPEDAEDAAQEVYIKLMSLGPAYSAVSPLVYKMAENFVKDLLRKDKVRYRTEEKAIQFFEDTIDYDDPLSLLEKEEATINFTENYNGLAPVFKEVMHLRYVEGMSYEEIAKQLGVTTGTVGSRIARAKEMLQV